MLNLLIALMGDLYDAVQETAYSQYLSSKAQLVLEAQAALHRRKLSATCRQALSPVWLQVLVPRTQESGVKAWSGKVAAVKSDVSTVKKMVETVGTSLMTQQKESEAHRKEVKEQLGKLEETIAQLAHAQQQQLQQQAAACEQQQELNAAVLLHLQRLSPQPTPRGDSEGLPFL